MLREALLYGLAVALGSSKGVAQRNTLACRRSGKVAMGVMGNITVPLTGMAPAEI